MEYSKPTAHWLGDPTVTVSETLALADVLAVSSDNGNILLTLGCSVTGEVFTTKAVLFNSPGVYSLPLPSGTINADGTYSPTSVSSTSAQATCWVRNDFWTVLSVRDTRAQSNPGSLKAGELCLQAPGAAGRVILKQDSSINLYTLKGSDSMGVFITPETDTIQASNAKGYGFQINDDGFSAFASNNPPSGGGLTLNISGNTTLLGTKQTQIDGANIVLGSVALPINAAVMNPNALTSALTSLTLAVTALQVAVVGFTGAGTFPGIAAVATSLAAVTLQISGLLPLISSQKVVLQ